MGKFIELLKTMFDGSLNRSFLHEAEVWADSVWSKIGMTYCGNCEIHEKDGYLTCELEVTLKDCYNSTGRFIREDEYPKRSFEVELEEWEQEELHCKGFFILKHYNG